MSKPTDSFTITSMRPFETSKLFYRKQKIEFIKCCQKKTKIDKNTATWKEVWYEEINIGHWKLWSVCMQWMTDGWDVDTGSVNLSVDDNEKLFELEGTRSRFQTHADDWLVVTPPSDC